MSRREASGKKSAAEARLISAAKQGASIARMYGFSEDQEKEAVENSIREEFIQIAVEKELTQRKRLAINSSERSKTAPINMLIHKLTPKLRQMTRKDAYSFLYKRIEERLEKYAEEYKPCKRLLVSKRVGTPAPARAKASSEVRRLISSAMKGAEIKFVDH